MIKISLANHCCHTNNSSKKSSFANGHIECTASRPISEVKQRWVWLVLGWVTAWEHQMLLAFVNFITVTVNLSVNSLFSKNPQFWELSNCTCTNYWYKCFYHVADSELKNRPRNAGIKSYDTRSNTKIHFQKCRLSNASLMSAHNQKLTISLLEYPNLR